VILLRLSVTIENLTYVTPPQRILYCVISVGRKKHHFKYLFVYKLVFMARRVIASDGTRLALHGVDQHWLKVQGDGVGMGLLPTRHCSALHSLVCNNT
jgi:hypothetical protein